MSTQERRRSQGTSKPNIYLLFQIIIICIISYIILQFKLGTSVTYAVVIVSIIFTIFFFIRRNEVINREVIEREIIDKKIIHHND